MATKPTLRNIGNDAQYGAEIHAVPLNENYTALNNYTQAVNTELTQHVNAVLAHIDTAIQNTSGVTGANVKEALITLSQNITAHLNSMSAHSSSAIVNESTVAGARVSDALNTLKSSITSSSTASGVINDSSIIGASVKDALNTLGTNTTNHINSTSAHNAQNITLTTSDPSLSPYANVKLALEGLSLEIGQIIAQSGTSDTEVVNARLSSVFGSFLTLKDRLDNTDVKKANLAGGNTFTGNQTVTDGQEVIIATDGPTNKRRYSRAIFGGSLYVQALNDVGTVVRSIAEFIHDGGMRIFGNLTVDGTLSVPTTVTTITSGFASGWSGVIQFTKGVQSLTVAELSLGKNVLPTSGEVIYTAPVGLRVSTSLLVRIEPLNSSGGITYENAVLEFNTNGQLVIYHSSPSQFRQISGVKFAYYTA